MAQPMWFSHLSVPLVRLTVLAVFLLGAGSLICLPLYHFDFSRFIRSRLFVKIALWVPIFLVFVSLLYLSNTVRAVVWLVLLFISLSEFIRVMQNLKKKRGTIPTTYFILFGVALLHFPLIGFTYKQQAIKLLITICLASVVADVMAFFMGNYVGQHKLPASLNQRKSWEGVAGQIIGALIGVLLVNAFVLHVSSLLIFVPIGVGSAVGDLANSYIKRLVGIQDWSNNIPGHGGYLDRLSSLAGSALFTFYFLKLTA